MISLPQYGEASEGDFPTRDYGAATPITFGIGHCSRLTRCSQNPVSYVPSRSRSTPPPWIDKLASGPPSTCMAPAMSSGSFSRYSLKSRIVHGSREKTNKSRPFESMAIAASLHRLLLEDQTLRR